MRLLSALIISLTCLCAGAQNRALDIVDQINNPRSPKVLVACHRGDWRNYPENSLKGIESVIKMGADIVEVDLALTRDSVLVLCHDRTLNRTTTGKGRVSDITSDSLSRLCLKTGHDIATSQRVPTLRQVLELCKDRIVVNIDKGWQYYDLVLALSDSLGVTDQLLIKGQNPIADVRAKLDAHPTRMMYMPVVRLDKGKREVYDSYAAAGVVPPAFELVWSELTPEVETMMKEIVDKGARLWVNTLWPSFNGGLCDDEAFEGNPDEIYGRLIGMGATMIQTDRPAFLLDYLRSKNLHD